MKLLITAIALAATLASPAFAQTKNRAATQPASQAYGQFILQAPQQRPARSRDTYLPGDSINANAASRALIRQDEMKDQWGGYGG